MSDIVIRDGTGNGYRSRVDEDNRLEVSSVSRAEQRIISRDSRNSFLLSTGTMNISSSYDTVVFWGMVTDASVRLLINNMWFSWNGGNTNHDRCLFSNTWVGMGAPLANSVEKPPGNFFLGDPKLAPMLSYVWDGVGQGITVPYNGGAMGEMIFDKGFTVLDILGTTIVSANIPVGVALRGEEDGVASFTMQFWIEYV